jgi:hypothetical protein
MAITGRIGQLLGGYPGSLHAKALAVFFHTEPPRAVPCLPCLPCRTEPSRAFLDRNCGTMGDGSNLPVGEGVGEHPIYQQAWLFEQYFFRVHWTAVTATRPAIPLVSPACQAGRRGILRLVGKNSSLCTVLTPIISAFGPQRSRGVTIGSVGDRGRSPDLALGSAERLLRLSKPSRV